MSGVFEKIAALPPEVLATTPVAPPPPGVVPNFQNPQTLVPLLLGVDTTFLALTTLFYGVRVYQRGFVQRIWLPEDTCCLFAYICAVVYYAAGVLASESGSLGRHAWEVHLDTIFFQGWYFTVWTTNVLTIPPISLAKITILLQYWRIFNPKRWMRICVWIGMLVLVPFTVAVTIVNIIFTSPWPGDTLISLRETWHSVYILVFVPPSGVIGAITDWYVLLLPIPAVCSLQLSRSKKIGIILIFLTGGLACVCSIVSCWYRFNLDLSDKTYSIAKNFILVQFEMWTGIIAACMPTFHQFWKRQAKLVWLSNTVKYSLSQLAGRSHSSRSMQYNREKDQSDNFRRVKKSSSLEPAYPLTKRDDKDIEHGYYHPNDSQIMVEYSYTIQSGSPGTHEISSTRGYAHADSRFHAR